MEASQSLAIFDDSSRFLRTGAVDSSPDDTNDPHRCFLARLHFDARLALAHEIGEGVPVDGRLDV